MRQRRASTNFSTYNCKLTKATIVMTIRIRICIGHILPQGVCAGEQQIESNHCGAATHGVVVVILTMY